MFAHVDPRDASVHTPYSAADCALIAAARAAGEPSARLADVRLPSGKTLRFEVRIGEHAVSKQIPQPPRSGLIQVNLDSGDTRVVVAQLVEKVDAGDEAAVRELLDAGADPNEAAQGVPSLVSAAQAGQPVLVRMLVRAGAELGARTARSALHVATLKRRTAAIDALQTGAKGWAEKRLEGCARARLPSPP